MKSCGFNFNTTYTALPKQFYTKLRPAPVPDPKIVIVNNNLAASMALDLSDLSEKEQAALFSGNDMPEGSTPFSEAYAGHQFGHFTMLGDGRAHLWGEHVTFDRKRFDIQFKGSGRTPYSRSGDGKAVLGPMLREYMISEAMYHLGIPTTRSLAVVTTGESVMRETLLPGAILTRVASSHIRVGTFEFAANYGDPKAIKVLMDYTIQRHYPELIDHENKALALIRAVMDRQADLIVHWIRVGFVHGVMNTDNMTLSGETIDYGPCAFMDAYDPNTVFSSIDHMGRYAYANQPKIAQWNIARFAETLLPFIDEDINKAISIAEETLHKFPEIYENKWLAMMRSKLGLSEAHANDEPLILDLLQWMQNNNADYTNTFRELGYADKPKGEIYQQKSFEAWYQRWQNRLQQQPNTSQSYRLMQQNNPTIIPRNHKVEEALKASQNGDFKPLYKAIDTFKIPYTYKEDPSLKPYQTLPTPGERIYQTFCGT